MQLFSEDNLQLTWSRLLNFPELQELSKRLWVDRNILFKQDSGLCPELSQLHVCLGPGEGCTQPGRQEMCTAQIFVKG